jgi:hypothetical protein
MTSEGFLHKYMLNNPRMSLNKCLRSFEIYERHLERFRGTSPVMLEVGVAGGGSLNMWREYLGPGARIVGVDNVPAGKVHENENIETFVGYQDDPALVAQILQKYPIIDIVLDNGSHQMKDMIGAFQLLYDRIAPCGVYIVMDTHTSYRTDGAGGAKVPGGFMEFVKERLDKMNTMHTRGALEVSHFTDAICCYDSAVIFERRMPGNRQSISSSAI